ncbi:HET-domain-containing protein [Lepidopterella palustris CBS 459.81]|uniref:HET-domain-containing protein n=1 Tax=Lepidopterella palustris CBS 459.81 TaxID=1314670 RepID=A0A8E2EH10_9PEZI|nr:HET-domain-containing protein [Lepidopterella palustris CBS 459.81]
MANVAPVSHGTAAAHSNPEAARKWYKRFSGIRKRLIYGQLYKPLKSDDSIRLLRLEPGKGDDPIVCTLQPTGLRGNHQPYEALSYVWGSRNSFGEITCNKQKIIIGKNLRHALHRLRKPGSPRMIWVDALCINQDDPRERGHQVRQMHFIYKKAAKVLVWLGKDHYGEAHDAFSTICSIANTCNVKKWIPRPATFRETTRGTLPPDTPEPPPLDSPLWEAVQSLFYNEWFVRMWVIQEITLASSADMIWGDCEIDWKWVGISVDHIRQDTKLHALLDSRNLQNAYFMHYICGQNLDRNPNSQPFLHLLDWARSFDVSDPKDKIYGLLGFPTKYTSLEKGSVFLEPDYTLDIHEIYTEVAYKIIQQDSTLDLLSFVTHDHKSILPSGELQFEFPSWVPDWSQKIALPYMPFVDLRDATKALEACIKACLKKGDGPRTVATTITAGRCEHGWIIRNEERHLADFAAFLLELDPDWLKDSWPEESEYLTELAEDIGNADRSKEALWRYTCYRTPFFTKKGKLGIGPGAMQDGDLICVLFGSQVPFVIRTEGDHYRFIGECYVGDIMEGEAIDMWEAGSEEVVEKVFEMR